MAKPALGRGLGNLLGDTQIASRPTPAPETSADSSAAEVSPGLGNLLRAGRAAEPAPESAPEQAPNTGRSPFSVYQPPSPPAPSAMVEGTVIQAPPWTLLAADILLIGLAALLVFKSPAPLKTWEMGVCVSAVVVGALLACLAVLTGKRL